MWRLMLLLALACPGQTVRAEGLALACPGQTVRAEGLPLVVEAVDQLVILCPDDCDFSRIVFIRGGRVLATRLACEDMLLRAHNDGWELAWQDYWVAERVVHARTLTYLRVEKDPTQGDDGLWWAMGRNMRDLRAPP